MDFNLMDPKLLASGSDDAKGRRKIIFHSSRQHKASFTSRGGGGEGGLHICFLPEAFQDFTALLLPSSSLVHSYLPWAAIAMPVYLDNC